MPRAAGGVRGVQNCERSIQLDRAAWSAWGGRERRGGGAGGGGGGVEWGGVVGAAWCSLACGLLRQWAYCAAATEQVQGFMLGVQKKTRAG